jgi:TRAP-type C4-dicarboxylate transport system permease small subunit
MSVLDRVLDLLDRATRMASIAAAVAIVAILLAQIFFRYALNSSIVWSEEVATWCLVWLVFLGSATIMRRWDHVNIPMLIQRLPMTVRPTIIILAKLVTCATCAVIAWYGVQIVMGTFHINSQTVGINTRWIKFAVPIGGALMAVFAFGCIVDDLRRLRRGDTEYFRRYGDIALDEAADKAEAIRTAAPGS